MNTSAILLIMAFTGSVVYQVPYDKTTKCQEAMEIINTGEELQGRELLRAVCIPGPHNDEEK